jgi:hypothetical protein
MVCRTDRTGGDDALGPEKRPPVLEAAALVTATAPIDYLDPQGIKDRDHSHKHYKNHDSDGGGHLGRFVPPA